MKFYSKLRVVEGFEITKVENVDTDVVIELENEERVALDSAMVARYVPAVGDYYVVNDDGYKYVNPKEVFESHYETTENLHAPSVALEEIQEKVVSESFGVEGNMVVCFVSFDNGFKTSGHSFCIHDEEFSEGLGRGVAFRNAAEKMWEIEGYHRMQQVHEIKMACEAYDAKREAND